jgi:hypothetical protein
MNDKQIFETILQITCIVSMANITNLVEFTQIQKISRCNYNEKTFRS